MVVHLFRLGGWYFVQSIKYHEFPERKHIKGYFFKVSRIHDQNHFFQIQKSLTLYTKYEAETFYMVFVFSPDHNAGT